MIEATTNVTSPVTAFEKALEYAVAFFDDGTGLGGKPPADDWQVEALALWRADYNFWETQPDQEVYLRPEEDL